MSSDHVFHRYRIIFIILIFARLLLEERLIVYSMRMSLINIRRKLRWRRPVDFSEIYPCLFFCTGFTGRRDTSLRFQIRGRDRETDQASLLGAGDRGGVMGGQDSGDGQVPRAAASPSAGPVHIRP